VVGGDDVVERRLDILEGGDRDDRAELFLAVELHAFLDREKYSRIEQGFDRGATAGIDHLGAFFHGVGDALIHVGDHFHLGQRCQHDACLPGHTDGQLADFLAEAAQELFGDGLVHEDHLDRRAPLAVEGERAGDAFLDRQFDVGIRHDDRRVLGAKAEDGAQAVGLRVRFLELVGDFGGADQGQHIDLA
jgi:hypothetical protein